MVEKSIVGADGSFDIRTMAAEYGWIYTGHVVDWLRGQLEQLRQIRSDVARLQAERDEAQRKCKRIAEIAVIQDWTDDEDLLAEMRELIT